MYLKTKYNKETKIQKKYVGNNMIKKPRWSNICKVHKYGDVDTILCNRTKC